MADARPAAGPRSFLLITVLAFLICCICVPARNDLESALGARALSHIVDLGLYNFVYVAAAVMLFFRPAHSPREGMGWRILALGMLCTAGGNAWYSLVLARLPEMPYPSMADVFYLSWYPACYLAIVLILTAHVGRFPLSVWLDGLVAGAGVAAIAAAMWFRPLTATDPGTPLLTVLASIAYPVFDLLLLVLLVGVLFILRTALRDWVLLLAAGLGVTAASDVLLSTQVVAGTYVQGGWGDIGFLFAIVLMVLAAHRSRRSQPVDALEILTRRRGGSMRVLLIPLLSAGASLALLALGQGERFPPVAGVFAAVCIGGAGLRAALTVRELAQMADVHREARTDDLTRLPNRRALYEECDTVLAAGVRNKTMTTMLLIDLDGFKDINDSLGHGAGDDLLVAFAQRVEHLTGPGELFARLGGDEFAVLLPRTSESEGLALAQEVVRAAREPFILAAARLTVDASIGVATTTAGPQGRGDLLRMADIAMYAAKGSPRRVCTPADAVDAHLGETRLALLSRLRDGLTGAPSARATAGRIEVLLQPKIDLADASLVGVEALARWREPDGTLLPPSDFLPLMSRAGLLPALATAVLSAALDAARSLADAGLVVPVAVNLSPVDVQDLALAERLQQLLTERDLPASALTVELTEDSLVTDPDRVAAVLSAVRAIGVRVSLDDFGTGYSSLSYLRRLPVDEVKLDRSFTLDIESDPAAEAVVKHTVGLVHALGLRIVAEGIEDGATAAVMRRLGCDQGQGFFWSRPTTCEDLLLTHLGPRRRSTTWRSDSLSTRRG
ncbi:bifunctional diguanylate cyclase/phosphodiesterase [Quadrisphaera sp. INWT6]|uniref:putative bifunctional diguanylate cyclase/phosphodiesterase n=1 Tax=Quadrisphaera sp. INWT6 TaxID=2596917 RepID=UPI0018920620|nr:bifunctional diguanylate cyclase/phosphodiesterase [Quadrisphaera sp. INWT6]MBF5080782.1 bifunctional diguanylate cyclase/phosphodiesterase [Quadrisphaera sp. INWT6]